MRPMKKYDKFNLPHKIVEWFGKSWTPLNLS